jgi:hypothetical protein
MTKEAVISALSLIVSKMELKELIEERQLRAHHVAELHDDLDTLDIKTFVDAGQTATNHPEFTAIIRDYLHERYGFPEEGTPEPPDSPNIPPAA